MYGGSGAVPGGLDRGVGVLGISNVTQRPPGCAPDGPITVASSWSPPMRMTAPGVASRAGPARQR